MTYRIYIYIYIYIYKDEGIEKLSQSMKDMAQLIKDITYIHIYVYICLRT
jgi:hypothetical protein